MKTADKKRKTIRESIKRCMENVCSFYVFLYLLVMAVWFPFFLTWGYRNAGTDKAMLFRFFGLGLLLSVTPCAFIYWICRWQAEGLKRLLKRVPDSDWLVLTYFLVTVVSFLCSENREEAFWGTRGWYIGFVTQVIYLLSYFYISRFLKGEKVLILLFIISTTVSFGLGILNRFSVYPIKLEGANPSFIATLGNINWFCGYWSVFFPIAVGMFYYEMRNRRSLYDSSGKLTWKSIAVRVLCSAYLALATATGALQGSDSAMLVFAAVTIVLFCVSCGEYAHRKAFYKTVLVMCGSCQVVRVVRVIFPDAINYDCSTIELLTGGNLTLIIFAAVLVLWGILHRLDKKAKQGIDAQRGNKIGRILRRERTVVLSLLVVCVLAFLFLLVCNTLKPGSIGALSRNPAFTFNAGWGSSRGVTWTAGLKVFDDMPIGRKLIGLGPDCFAYGVYKNGSSAVQMVTAVFGNSRLTNAHNEWITVLVNAGILGFLSYVGFFFAKAIRYIKNYEKSCGQQLQASALMLACGLALAGYMSHNLFSFQQALNGPFIFIMMGIGEALIRKSE